MWDLEMTEEPAQRPMGRWGESPPARPRALHPQAVATSRPGPIVRSSWSLEGELWVDELGEVRHGNVLAFELLAGPEAVLRLRDQRLDAGAQQPQLRQCLSRAAEHSRAALALWRLDRLPLTLRAERAERLELAERAGPHGLAQQADAAATAGWPAPPPALALPDPIAPISSIAIGRAGHAPFGRTVLRLALCDPDRVALDAPLLQELFALTQAEARVAVGLAAGLDAERMAAHQGVQVNTIQAHVKKLLSKTGTRRQAELVALLLRCAARLPAVATSGSA